jgi:glucan 1,3-beta-glucosidase
LSTIAIAKMRVHSLLQLLIGGIGVVVADEIKIPWVESVVASMIEKFEPAVEYSGPTGTALAALAALETSVAKIVPRAATPYWLEQIKHQGISAFHSTPSTYQVFRNVKSFGAKGKSKLFLEFKQL